MRLLKSRSINATEGEDDISKYVCVDPGNDEDDVIIRPETIVQTFKDRLVSVDLMMFKEFSDLFDRLSELSVNEN